MAELKNPAELLVAPKTAEEHLLTAEEHLANAETMMDVIVKHVKTPVGPTLADDVEVTGSLILLFCNLAAEHRKMAAFYIDNPDLEAEEPGGIDAD